MFPNLNTVEDKETTNYIHEEENTIKIESVSNSNQNKE